MDYLATTTLLLVLLTASLAVDGSAPENEAEEEEGVAAISLVADRVQVLCQLSSTVEVGRPLPVVVQVMNSSDEAIAVAYRDRLRNTTFSVANAAGDPIPLTRWGRMWIQEEGNVPLEENKFSTVSLEAGETMEIEEDLARYFDLSIPGDYVVKISWHSRRTEEKIPRLLDHVEGELKFKVVEAVVAGTGEDHIQTAEGHARSDTD